MSISKTESRIPANFQPSDLGQPVVSEDKRCTLVSFITAPLAVNRRECVFVTDAALAAATQSGHPTPTETEQVEKWL